MVTCHAQITLLTLSRYERLEDQLHDLTDLHQHETADLKQELASAEEKAAYQAYERSRDIQVLRHPARTAHWVSTDLRNGRAADLRAPAQGTKCFLCTTFLLPTSPLAYVADYTKKLCSVHFLPQSDIYYQPQAQHHQYFTLF